MNNFDCNYVAIMINRLQELRSKVYNYRGPADVSMLALNHNIKLVIHDLIDFHTNLMFPPEGFDLPVQNDEDNE